ncbi:MAG: CarD family transcriptional regulator [Candidatus Desulfofervidus auxilii]|nr:CarD family transcriptional regulator [Candidatus Desulfofervidus auxilii]
MFKIGDLAVYPAHGVGIIESIEKKELSGETKDFYAMRILENGMLIFIPIENAKAIGLRPVVSQEEVPKIYSILKEKPLSVIDPEKNHNKRYRELVERLKTGSIFDVATLLRDLAVLKEEKGLSYSEKKLMDTACRLLVTEIAIAKKCDPEEVEVEIKQILSL